MKKLGLFAAAICFFAAMSFGQTTKTNQKKTTKKEGVHHAKKGTAHKKSTKKGTAHKATKKGTAHHATHHTANHAAKKAAK